MFPAIGRAFVVSTVLLLSLADADEGRAAGGLDFYTLAPCRIMDTRGSGAVITGPIFQGQETRIVSIVDKCFVPTSARAVSLNVTVTQPSVAGQIRMFRADLPLPGSTTLNYVANQTRANNATVALDDQGRLAVYVGQAVGSTTHFIIDVNGYYATPTGAPTPVPNGPPLVGTVSPATGGNVNQIFSFTFSDPNGFADLSVVQTLVSAPLNGANACYVDYRPSANTARLLNDAGTAWLGPVTLGTATSLTNAQCTLEAIGSSASGSGQVLTLNLALTFSSSGFGGAKNVFMFAQDSIGSNPGWQPRGTWTVPAPSSAWAGNALLVTDGSQNADDNIMRDRLGALGYAVTIKDCWGVQWTDADGKAIVVIGSSVVPDAIVDKLRFVTAPVIVTKPGVYKFMRMTGTAGGTDMGNTTGQSVVIASAYADHMLAAGLTGTPLVSATPTSINWGVPGGGVNVIATMPGNAGQAAIFSYEKDAPMIAGGGAVARRVGLFPGPSTASNLTTEGKRLFDNAVRWITLPPGSKTALLITGSTALVPGDMALRDRLVALGYGVVVKSASDALSVDAIWASVVVISRSASAASLGNKFQAVTTPVLVSNPDVFAAMGFTSAAAGSVGSASGATKVSMATLSHPMAAGLSGPITTSSFPSAFGWGVPNANAQKVATLLDDASRSAIFAYERGVSMVGLPAPARRAGYYLQETAAANMTTDGGRLFNAAIKWLVNQFPFASAGGPYEVRRGHLVSFSAALSADSDGTIVSYVWDFGDGSATELGVARSHQYVTEGTFTAKVTVTDDLGAAVTGTAVVTVLPNRSPIIVLNGPGSCHAPCTGNFTASVSDPDGDPITTTWSGCATGQTEMTVTCSRATAGTSTATLKATSPWSPAVTDDAGLTGTNAAPIVTISPPSSNPCTVPCRWTLVASGNDPDGDAVAYAWRGCALGQSGSTAICTIEQPGTVVAVVTAVDGRGGSTTAQTQIVALAATANLTPIANGAGPYSGTVGKVVSFDGRTSRDADGRIASYAWVFGDGSAPMNGPTPLHAYAAPGSFTATLTVTDDDGGSATATAAVVVTTNSDSDDDGLSNAQEATLGSNPNDPDTNDDGVNDGAAYRLNLSLTSSDTDSDGLTNAVELTKRTDPVKADTDGDTVSDGQDAFPLDPTRSQPLSPTPGDTTAPVLTLERPADAVEVQ